MLPLLLGRAGSESRLPGSLSWGGGVGECRIKLALRCAPAGGCLLGTSKHKYKFLTLLTLLGSRAESTGLCCSVGIKETF